MGYFCRRSLINKTNIRISVIFNMIFVISFLFIVPNSLANDDETAQLFESYSREEMAKIAGYGEEKLSTVLVTGSVHCEACLHESQLHAWPISGVSVAVNCRSNEKIDGKSKWIKGVTDENGDFSIDLPSNLHAIPNLDRKCCIKVLRLPKNSLCKPASVTRHKGLKLSSFGSGIRTYSAGTVRFQHLASTPRQGCGRKDPKISKMLS